MESGRLHIKKGKMRETDCDGTCSEYTLKGHGCSCAHNDKERMRDWRGNEKEINS